MTWHRKQYDKQRTRGRRWMSMREVVLIEEPVCKVCNRKPSAQVDHIIPISKGGTDVRDNLQGICIKCHDAKTADDLGLKQPKQRIGIDGYPIPNEPIAGEG